MPMITIRYTTPSPKADLRPQLAVLANRLSTEILGKPRDVTAVLVEYADPQGWFIANERPTEAGLSAFWLDIKVTDKTNTKTETTRFVRETFAAMEKLLGPLHPESYVLVHATDGDAYGYGGRTQNSRWAADQLGHATSHDRLLRQF